MAGNKTRARAVVWLNKSPDRYVPKSLDGGTGWGVWDRQSKRFVPDNELDKFEYENVREQFHDG